MKIPDQNDINPTGCMITENAVKVFLGKSIEEAFFLIKNTPLHLDEELGNMGPKAFEYYLYALEKFIHDRTSVLDDLLEYGISIFRNHLINDNSKETMLRMYYLTNFIILHWSEIDKYNEPRVKGKWENLHAAIFRCLK